MPSSKLVRAPLSCLSGASHQKQTSPRVRGHNAPIQCPLLLRRRSFDTHSHLRSFAQVKDTDKLNRDVYFTSSNPVAEHQTLSSAKDHEPPDERTLQLGKTVRILHERLPTLLKEPLPSEILSPQISLHLFPSTHPHLPTVSGRIAYIAALWTAPVAWGRLPLVGNVNLTILSERMARAGGPCYSSSASNDEKLIVKWRTCGKTTHRDGTGGIYSGSGGINSRDPMDKIKGFISGTTRQSSSSEAPTSDDKPEEEFCGIFVFEFDEQGRVIKHVIEHTEGGGHWDHMTRVVSVTDWLLGRFSGRRKEEEPVLAWCSERRCEGGQHRFIDAARRR